jgi:hypothetical protein
MAGLKPPCVSVGRSRARRAIPAVTSALGATLAIAWGLGILPVATTVAEAQPPMNCQTEQYPAAGAASNAPFTPYEIPFSATLGPNPPPSAGALPSVPSGGYLEISNGLLTAVLGGGPAFVPGTPGQIYGRTCGLFQLPNETGTINPNPEGFQNDTHYNNNFQFVNPIPVSVSVRGISGLPVLTGYGAADGQLTAAIDLTPAANGGLNVVFNAGAKSTSDFGPALSVLGPILGQITGSTGNECTIPIGDLRQAGVPPADLAVDGSGVSPVTGLTYAQETAPAKLTTGASGNMTGQPITGPITAAQATLVSNDFPVGKVDPNTPPAPDAPGASNTTPSTLCTPQNASLLNNLLGLPSIPDPATKTFPNAFFAPSTFAIHTTA